MVSSAVEHCLHTAGVTGSIPVLPTRIGRAGNRRPFLLSGDRTPSPFDFCPPLSRVVCHCSLRRGIYAAMIRQRGKYSEAQIRRRGWPSLSRSFDIKAAAEAWARRSESEMDRSAFVDRSEAERNAFGGLLERYAEEISPQQNGGHGKIMRIRKIGMDPLAQYKESAVSGKVIADRRLWNVSGPTVNRELTLIGHVLSIARNEWGIHLETNPVSVIRRPRENRARNSRPQPRTRPEAVGVPLLAFPNAILLSNRLVGRYRFLV